VCPVLYLIDCLKRSKISSALSREDTAEGKGEGGNPRSASFEARSPPKRYDDAVSETRRFEIAQQRERSDDDVLNENHRTAVSSRPVRGIFIENTRRPRGHPRPVSAKRELSPRAPPSSRYFVPRCENREKREERDRICRTGGGRKDGKGKRRKEKVEKKREERQVKRPARKNEPLAVLPRARASAREREESKGEFATSCRGAALPYLYGRATGSAIEFRGKKRAPANVRGVAPLTAGRSERVLACRAASLHRGTTIFS